MTALGRRALLCLVFLSLGFLAGRYWTLLYVDRAVDWPATFGALANVAQIVAFAVGGWWTYRLFIHHRVDQARADVTHLVQELLLREDKLLLRVFVQIHNVGNVELRPPSGTTVIQSPQITKTGELGWEELNRYEFDFLKDTLILEPGETERYPLDFLLSPALRVIQIHTTISCGTHVVGEFWDETTILHLAVHEGEQLRHESRYIPRS